MVSESSKTKSTKTKSSKPDSTKKTRKMVVRFDHDTAEFIDSYAEMVGTNKTQLIRNAVTSAIFLNAGNPEYYNPKSIVSQSMLHFLFDRCSEAELKHLAKMSYDLSMVEFNTGASQDFKAAAEFLREPEAMVKNLVKFIFSPEGHGWFDQSDYIMRGTHITIYGKHNMGPNFHIFAKELMQLYANRVNHEIIRERYDARPEEYDFISVKRRFYSISFTIAPKKK